MNEVLLSAQETVEGYAKPRSSNSHLPMYLVAAVLAVVASLTINFLEFDQIADYFSKVKNLGESGKETPAGTQTSLSSSQSSPIKQEKIWAWPQVNPKAQLIWYASNLQILDDLPNYESTDVNPESVNVFRRGYLPLMISPDKTSAKQSKVSTQRSDQGGPSPMLKAGNHRSAYSFTAGELPQHQVALNIRPMRRDVEVNVNGVSVDAKAPLSLPMGIPSTITITRPNFQTHHILIRPTPQSPTRIPVSLRRVNLSKPMITLHAHHNTAQLSVTDAEGGEHVVGTKMGRYTYQPQQKSLITLRAELSPGLSEVWRISPHEKDAYTVHFDNLAQGKRRLKLNGKARFKVRVEPLPEIESSDHNEVSEKTHLSGVKTGKLKGSPKTQSQSSQDPSNSSSRVEKKKEERLPYSVDLESAEALVTLTDSIDGSQYQFVTPVFANYEVTWQMSRDRSPIDQSRPWRLDAKDLRKYRARKRRGSGSNKLTKREAKLKRAKSNKLPQLDD